MLPVIFAQHTAAAGGPLPPQPTGVRNAATADGSLVNFLSVAEANFDLETSKWHGFFWVLFDEFPETPGTLYPVLGQYNEAPDDSAFAVGAINTLGGDKKFAVTTCRDTILGHIFDNTLADDYFTNHGPVLNGVWYFVDYWLDTDLSQVSIRVNGSADGQTISTIADLPSCISVVDLQTFLFVNSPFPDQYILHGRLGGTGFRRGSKWSDAEMAYLYNAGCQILHSEVNLTAFPAFFTDLYCWWDMQEGSGVTRDNAQGTAARDLLNNGTVGQSCGTCYTCTSPLLTNLFGAYHADELVASSVLLDATVSARDFTQNNSPPSVAGVFSTARLFTAASSQSFSRADEAAQGFTANLSVAGWIKQTSNAGTQSIFQKWMNGVVNSMFRVFHPGSGLGTKFEFTSTINGDNTADAPAGQWVHGAWVYNGAGATNADRLKHYRNGILQTLVFTGTVPATLGASTQPLRIGGTGPNDYDGAMDEAALWSKSLTIEEVVEHMNNVHPWSAASPLLTNLYGAWHFDEETGVAIDTSGNGHHLSDNNSVTSFSGAPTPGANGSRLFTAANSEFLSRVTEPAQQFTTGLSVACWLNPASLLADMPIVSKYSTPGDRMFLIDQISGALFCFLSSGSIYGDKAGVLVAGTWVHICFTFDGTLTANVTGVYSDSDRLKLYIDGVGQQVLTIGGTIPSTLPASTAALVIGSHDTGTVYYDGQVDELGIWSRAISQPEVAMHKSGVFPWKKS